MAVKTIEQMVAEDEAALARFLKSRRSGQNEILDAGDPPQIPMREFSGTSLCFLDWTRNEWLRFAATGKQPENPRFATLAWIYIQTANWDEVYRIINNGRFVEEVFNRTVMEFAQECGFTQAECIEAEGIINQALLDTPANVLARAKVART